MREPNRSRSAQTVRYAFGRPILLRIAAFALLNVPSAIMTVDQAPGTYFDLGPHLVEDFRGTYEFKHKHVEFVQTAAGGYLARSSGDESPQEDRLVIESGYVCWVLGGSNGTWLKIRVSFRSGDRWEHVFRGWNQQYVVTDTDLAVSVPAGGLQHCARLRVSWVAHEPDMEGPQEIVLYLAPHLGIVKRELWSNSSKYHEEVLTKYARPQAN